jgi:hypothetical protein
MDFSLVSNLSIHKKTCKCHPANAEHTEIQMTQFKIDLLASLQNIDITLQECLKRGTISPELLEQINKVVPLR